MQQAKLPQHSYLRKLPLKQSSLKFKLTLSDAAFVVLSVLFLYFCKLSRIDAARFQIPCLFRVHIASSRSMEKNPVAAMFIMLYFVHMISIEIELLHASLRFIIALKISQDKIRIGNATVCHIEQAVINT